jgi:hypothetical protein
VVDSIMVNGDNVVVTELEKSTGRDPGMYGSNLVGKGRRTSRAFRGSLHSARSTLWP